MAAQRIMRARAACEILRVTSRFLAQCRNPHVSRVFVTSDDLAAPSRRLRGEKNHASHEACAGAGRRDSACAKFFSRGGVESAREGGIEIENVRISVR
jgi:hypothetical protein